MSPSTRSPRQYYRTTAEAASAEAVRLRRRMHRCGTLRLSIVVALVAGWVVWGAAGGGWLVGGSTVAAVAFVAGVVAHQRLARRRQVAERLERLCEDELKGLAGDHSAFDGAAERVSAGHPFSLDLDIFGDRSLFQAVNRTVTPGGRAVLADWFERPLTGKAAIEARQRAARELAGHPALRHHFIVVGSTAARAAAPDTTLSQGAAGLPARGFWRVAVWVVPAVWVALGAGFAAGVVPAGVLALWFLASLVIGGSQFVRINKLYNRADKLSAALRTGVKLLEIAEGADLTSELFVGIRRRLLPGGLPASRAIRRLARRVEALDQRGSMAGILLNIFMLRDIRSALGLARWYAACGPAVEEWFAALADFDALVSLAGYAFNRPDDAWPEIAEGYFTLAGRGLGHPLLPAEGCVRNDLEIDRHPYVMIVTGANMAGKSTWLRTVGVNFVLACLGAPVCAARLTVSPCALVTGLHTADSLAGGESYFFAELKRIGSIIERLRSGERLFVLLDEILKGTNSVDKQKGSLALVRQLVALDACGIVATHDLALGALAGESAGSVGNYRFEAEVRGDGLSFAYTLRPGVAENMNACRLMRKMGILVD